MLGRLRILMLVVPLVFVILVEGLSDSFLDAQMPFPADTIVVAIAISIAGVVMWALAFRFIDRLRDELTARNAELEARNASARALHAMSVSISALADLGDILNATAANARTLLSADLALLVLVGEDGEERLAAASGRPDAFDATGGQARDDGRRFLRAKHEAYLAAPLQRGGETIGTLAVATDGPRTHGIDDLETLGSLANQAAIAIENSRLQGELRDLAVTAERERIAREMHDGLAQVLGYVNTKSQAVEELLVSGRSAEARAQMSQLAAAARSIYVDVREAILGLSTPLGGGSGGEGLARALEAYGRRFGEAAKLVVSVEAPGTISGLDLSPEVVANLLRIAQESLTNVRKHAAAHRVVVRLTRRPDALEMLVEDDGRGFDPHGPDGPSDWPHFGREAIRQRAAAIGGQVSWESMPGQGTRVLVVLPA
jgi:signal transduction histidine kinase